MRYKPGYCSVCKENTAFTSDETNHLVHFLITLFFFPWLIAWIIASAKKKRATCTKCGTER